MVHSPQCQYGIPAKPFKATDQKSLGIKWSSLGKGTINHRKKFAGLNVIIPVKSSHKSKSVE